MELHERREHERLRREKRRKSKERDERRRESKLRRKARQGVSCGDIVEYEVMVLKKY